MGVSLIPYRHKNRHMGSGVRRRKNDITGYPQERNPEHLKQLDERCTVPLTIKRYTPNHRRISMNRDSLSIKGTAEFLGVSTSFVYRQVALGNLPCERYSARLIRIRKSDLEKYRDERRHGGK